MNEETIPVEELIANIEREEKLCEALNNLPIETRDTVFMVMSYEGVEYFNNMLLKLYEEFKKQKFKEQEEIRDEYYKLLDNV